MDGLIEVGAEVVLPVPPERAFALLSRWEEQPRWMRDAADVRVMGERRAGTGVWLAVRTRLLGLPVFTEVLEVVVWEPPGRIVVAHRGFVRGTGEWDLVPVAEGTRFAWRERLWIPVPVLGGFALRLYRPLMRRLMQRSLAGLRRLAEARAGRPS